MQRVDASYADGMLMMLGDASVIFPKVLHCLGILQVMYGLMGRLAMPADWRW